MTGLMVHEESYMWIWIQELGTMKKLIISDPSYHHGNIFLYTYRP